MLRVGAVAKTICEHFKGEPIDMTSVVAACLLHDMGNIIKFDLTRFPSFLEPKGLVYWENVQEKYKERYGTQEHIATELILEEIGVTDRVRELVQTIDFYKAEENAGTDDFEKKICDYADNRVDPNGIVSLDERLLDLQKRYGKKYPGSENEQRRELYGKYLHQIEDQIFAHCNISPESITNESVNGTITSLINCVVPLKGKQ